MKRILTIAASILFGVMLQAQDTAETSRVQLLYDQAIDAILNDEYDKAKELLDAGFGLAEGDLLREYNDLYGYLCEIEAFPYYYSEPERAFVLYQKAYEYYKAARVPRCIDALKHMGILKKKLNQYEDALAIWDFAIEKFDKTQYPVIEIMIDKKITHEALNQHDYAAMLSTELRRLYDSVKDPQSKALILKHFANDACEKQLFPLAWALFEELDVLLPQVEEVYRENIIFSLVDDRHSLLFAEKKYDEAIELMLGRIAQVEQVNPDSDDLLFHYTILANDYAEINEKSKAIEVLQKVLDLQSEQNVDPYLKSYRFLTIASIYSKMKMEKEAMSYVEMASELNLQYEGLLLMRANLLFNMGRYKAAQKVYKEYSEYIAACYGEYSLQYAQSLRYLANINAFSRKFNEASEYYIRAAELAKDIFIDSYRYVSISEREAFLRDFYRLFSEMSTFGLSAGYAQDEFTETAYDALLLSKGLLLSSDNSLSALVYGSENDELIKLFESCKDLNTEIEVYKASDNTDSGRLSQMYQELLTMERTLQDHMGHDGEYVSFLNVDYQKIRTQLQDNEIVIDFTEFPGKKDPNRIHYAAYVYRKDWEHPRLIKVFEAEDLQKLMNEGYQWDCYGNHSKDIVKLLFKPLQKYMRDGDVVYWVPSGDLHKISVESLLIQADIDTCITVRQLSSARVIVDRCPQLDIKTAALYGGLDFSTGEKTVSATGSGKRNQSAIFEKLPRSYDEVCHIKEVLERADCKVEMFNGPNGTEESFTAYSGDSPDLIHFSTHGFYYSPSESAAVSSLSGFTNSMFLSGLILSGGNYEWSSSNLFYNDKGGVLTADDIAKLDLSDTEMVVLSACETAQGEVTAEGVYGLQRAFKKAGVDKILMTLWHVNDTVSKDFMQEFYDGLISDNLQPDEALMRTKAIFRDAGYSPYYWAGYVLLD